MHTTITDADVKKAIEVRQAAEGTRQAAEAACVALYDTKRSRFTAGEGDEYIAERDRLHAAYAETERQAVVAGHAVSLDLYVQTRQALGIIVNALCDAPELVGKNAEYKRTHNTIWKAIERAGLTVERSERTTSGARIEGYWVTIGHDWSRHCCVSVRNEEYGHSEQGNADIWITDEHDTITVEDLENARERLARWADVTAADCIEKAGQYYEDRREAIRMYDEAHDALEKLGKDYAAFGLDAKAFYMPARNFC